MAARLDTTYSTIVWSPDGTSVTKTRLAAPDARRRFRNELRVNTLLNACAPPLRTPALIGHDVCRRSLTFVAVRGEPLGPKYPRDLPTEQLDAIIELGTRSARLLP